MRLLLTSTLTVLASTVPFATLFVAAQPAAIGAPVIGAPNPAPAANGPRSGLDYEQQAKSILKGSEFQDANAALLEMDSLLDRQFVRARIGLYDLYMHKGALRERANVEKFRTVCDALVDQQEAWLDWISPARRDLKSVYSDIETLRTWVRHWDLEGLRALDGGSVLDGLDARDKQRAASAGFSEFMGLGKSLDLERDSAQHEKLILGPTRQDFVSLVCFAGLLRPELRSIYWQPGITNWTQSYVDDYKFVALQYTAPGTALGSIGPGLEMNYSTNTGLQQQVTQLATNWLLMNYFGDHLPPSLAGGLAVNLVIDIYGRCQTRVDGDLRERRTDAREVFVPGGNPNGGILPPESAESRWRRNGGEDHFTDVLHQAQADGGQKSRRGKDKISRFQLLDDHKVKRTVVQGPYLGSAASEAEAPPEDFYGDRLEFLRAYRSCFLNWLRTNGDGSSKTSPQKFAALLMDVAHMDDPTKLEGLIAETFETEALSTPDLSKKDLEGRFLAWLSKHK